MKILVALPLLAALLSSCGPVATTGGSSNGYLTAFRTAAAPQDEEPLHARGFWDGDGEEGPSSITIMRDEQKAYFYKGKQLDGMSPIATGKSTHTTPAGSFEISQKSPDHKSSLYGVIRDTTTGEVVNGDADTRKHRAKAGQVFENAPMPYFMRFNGGIGMHVGHLPGYAASHGCVRMPEPMAKKFFENVKIGTPVIVE
ncbi:L,D-transpeptidase family protein [Akkermansiaceae bacterium]|nr:L,D-transpeptidase family protein [Akkermansiaceae bacterium]